MNLESSHPLKVAIPSLIQFPTSILCRNKTMSHYKTINNLDFAHTQNSASKKKTKPNISHLKRTSSPNIHLNSKETPKNQALQQKEINLNIPQIGDPSEKLEDSSSKRKTTQENVKISSVKCGDDYTYFIEKGSGKIYACGSNRNNNLGFVGELKENNDSVVLKPTPTGVANINQITTDGHSTIMWNNKKSLYFYWGNNKHHKLGVDHMDHEIDKSYRRTSTSLEKNRRFTTDMSKLFYFSL